MCRGMWIWVACRRQSMLRWQCTSRLSWAWTSSLSLAGGWSDLLLGDKTPCWTPSCLLQCAPASPHVQGVLGCCCRFFAEACATLVCQVFGRRQRDVPQVILPAMAPAPALGSIAAATVVAPPSVFDYYITDGLYGSFNCIMYDHAQPMTRPLRCPTLPPLPPGKDGAAGEGGAAFASTVFGPSCDGLDTVFQVSRCSSVASAALVKRCLLQLLVWGAIRAVLMLFQCPAVHSLTLLLLLRAVLPAAGAAQWRLAGVSGHGRLHAVWRLRLQWHSCNPRAHLLRALCASSSSWQLSRAVMSVWRHCA